MHNDTIAFIGLGIMGAPMAGHLLAAGHALVVHTRTRARADAILARGATWAGSPAAAARGASVVFTCLPDTPDVQQVLLGDDGVIHADAPGQVIVDHSTISPSATREMGKRLAERGKVLLDAPVSGGDAGAQNATLSIMVGGERAVYERVLPLLQTMGKTITHCGAGGNGQLTKLVNQILVSITNLAVSEALTFAQRGGLDMERTLRAVGGGAASSWQLANLGPKMIAGDYRPGFTVDLQVKDLRLVEEAMERSGIRLRAVPLVRQLLQQAQAAGHGTDGTQALFRIVRDGSSGPREPAGSASGAYPAPHIP